MRDIGLTMQECIQKHQAIDIGLGYITKTRWKGMVAFGVCETPNFICYEIGIHEVFMRESIGINEFKATIRHKLLHTLQKLHRA